MLLPSAPTISTMRIESVSEKPDRAGMYRVKTEDGKTLRFYRQTIEDFTIYPGRELSEDEVAALEKHASALSAKMRAVRIISASSVSKRDLQKRLEQKGENAAQAKEAVQWLEDLNLLDDRNTARQVVSHCIAKGYGKNRAKQALYEKKIPKEYWEEALADYPEQQEKIMAYLRNKLPDPADEKAKKRAIDGLARRGFSWGEIRAAMNTYCDGYDLEEF